MLEALEVAVDEVEEVLVKDRSPKGPAAEHYLSLVDRLSDKYGLDRSRLLIGGLSHKHDAVAAARRLIVLTLREPPYKYSYPTIGLAMGRNHTSIMRLCTISKEAVREMLVLRVREENARFQAETAVQMLEELEQVVDLMKEQVELSRPLAVVEQVQLATLRIETDDEDDDCYDDPDKRYYLEVVALLKRLPSEQRQAVWVEACKRLFPETWESASETLPREIRLLLD